MARPRDNQRGRVLTAERAFAKRLDNPLTTSQLQSLANRITKSAWFRKQNLPFTDIQVWLDTTRTVCEQRPQKGLLVMYLHEQDANAVEFLHELAHHIAPKDGKQLHGPEYCKAMLECVRKWIGPEQKKALLAEYHLPPRVKTRVYSDDSKESLRNNAARARATQITADLADLLTELAPTD